MKHPKQKYFYCLNQSFLRLARSTKKTHQFYNIGYKLEQWIYLKCSAAAAEAGEPPLVNGSYLKDSIAIFFLPAEELNDNMIM